MYLFLYSGHKFLDKNTGPSFIHDYLKIINCLGNSIPNVWKKLQNIGLKSVKMQNHNLVLLISLNLKNNGDSD